MAVLIEASDLEKRFGEILAVDGISLEVQQGEVLGFLGPNGAGKSTTMKMITGFLEPDAGSARIAGVDVLEHPKLAKAQARLPARGRALLRRHDGPRLPHLRRRDPRLRPRGGQAPRRRRGREDAARLRAGAADRDAVEGLQAPRRPRPGDPARPAGADPGRADRRPRSQPEARGAQADRRDGRRTRRSSSRRTSWRRWRRCARAPSSSTAAASSPTARPRTSCAACPITTPSPLSVACRPGRGRRQGAVRVLGHRQGRDAGRRQRQGAAARTAPAPARPSPPSSPPSSARG